jgi:hypothetical protein
LDTDEAGFTRNCVFNSRNTHIWSEENPHEIQERHFQQSCSLNVWVGIIENHLIGPYVLPRRLTVDGYLQFLNEVLPELLEGVLWQLGEKCGTFTTVHHLITLGRLRHGWIYLFQIVG